MSDELTKLRQAKEQEERKIKLIILQFMNPLLDTSKMVLDEELEKQIKGRG